jgi:hypothetical protein
VSEYDYEEIKSITMRQLYGGIEEKYKHIKYLVQAREFINDYWNKFQRDGFIVTPFFGRRITGQHLQDANPSKVFNYILQATETEIAISAVKVVNQYIQNKKTKSVLYTYDSLLFDFYKEDGINTLIDIVNIMKINDRFPVKVYIGESYESIKQIYT